MNKDIVWNKKDLLDIESLSVDEIQMLLTTAKSFLEVSSRDIKKVPTLRGKTIVSLFFESSTRTRASFELAAKRSSADFINISANVSSLSKGETILDTAKNLEAMNVDLLITRHQSAGVPHLLASNLSASVINAGDGCRAHPTQALLDLLTIQQHKSSFKGLKVLIVGDIRHSRVARSNMIGLKCLGAEVIVCGPPTLIPEGVTSYGVKVVKRMDEVIADIDVLMVLRIQLERQKDHFLPSIREYAKVYGITESKLQNAKQDLLIMHPGPINRGVELSAEVADGKRSVILEQVTNGVAMRMAILYTLLSRKN